MAQIIVAEIEAYDPAIRGVRTLRYGTQSYVHGVGSIVEPTADARITVTRAGVATRVNSQGLIESVAADTPRFDYDPASKALRGLLVEESRQNVVLSSANVSANLTVAYSSTITADAATAPDGTTTADRVQNTAGTISLLHWDHTIPASATNVWYPSIFVKKGNTSAVTLNCWISGNPENNVTFNLDTGAVSGVPIAGEFIFQAFPDGWFRIGYRLPVDATGTGTNLLFRIWETQRGAGVAGNFQFYWGRQLELGAFPTSYIPTSGAAVTRNADNIAMTGADFSAWYNTTEGTLFCEWEQQHTAITVPAGITDGALTNRFSIVGGPNIGGRITVSNVTTNPATVPAGLGVQRAALAYTPGNSAQASNGTLNGTFSPSGNPAVTRLDIGSQSVATSAVLNGHVRRIYYWQSRLTNTQLVELTDGERIPSGAALELDFMGSAQAFFDGRIQQPANIRRECFRDGRTFGRTQIGYGEMVLVNNDGALDPLLEYSFSGRRITILLGTVLPNSSPISWVTVLRGTMEQAELSWQKITVRVRDRQQDLAQPLQQIKYSGNGSTLEGAADLEGKPKPIVYGKVFNISPPMTDTTRRIYQLHHGSAVVSVDAVYDRGTLLTAGAAYTSQSQMETTAPSAGQYRVWNDATAGCFIRLGSAPAGTVTANVTAGASRTVAQLYNSILLKAGISASDISASDISALDAAVSYEAGVYAPHDKDTTALELLDELCASVGAWYGADASGVFRIGRIVVPTGDSVGTITATEILRIERVASRDPGVGIPAWKVKLDYQRIYSVQKDLGSTVPEGTKTFMASEYRRTEASDAATKTANLFSPELTFQTALWNKADAANEATRLLNIYKSRRDVYEVTVRVDAALASVLDLGRIVTLQVNRLGMSSGKKFLIIGIRTNMRGYQFDLTLWG